MDSIVPSSSGPSWQIDMEALGILFEKLKTPYQMTPGVTQLYNIRSFCIPLVRMLDFKDRVARAHSLLITKAFARAKAFDPTDAIPDGETMANLIITLKDICIDRASGRKLLYHGLQSAAWVMEYARDILGLDILPCSPRRHNNTGQGNVRHIFGGSLSSSGWRASNSLAACTAFRHYHQSGIPTT